MEETQEQTTMGPAQTLEPAISIAHQSDHDFVDTWLSDAVLRQSLTFRHDAKWHTAKRVADLPADALIATATSTYQECAVLYVRGALVQLYLYTDDSCHAHVYAERYSVGDFEAVVAHLKLWLPPKSAPEPDRVTMGFRYLSRQGSRYRQRTLQAPAWREIASNYTATVRDAVSDVAITFTPGAGGKLVLLHGSPGTGKTYVIRALAREWQSWCRFEYITDPEKFLGDTDYMMHVLVEGHRDGDGDSEDEDMADRWRMLILEDAGELLARDAKVREGQGLSRLLNFGEGLLGQGLHVLTLITTNEKLAALNDAVARPGRTALEIEFGPLDVDECNAWLAANDPRRRAVDKPMTLAELYALIAGHRRTAQQKPLIGFRGGR